MVHLLRRYPRRSAAVLGCLFLAGLFEGIGILGLLPVLEIAGGTDRSDSPVAAFFAWIGIEPTLGILLVGICVLLGLKAGLSLVAMSYVGSVNATLASELRSRVILAVMKARWGFFVSRPIGEIVNSVVTESRESTSVYRATCQLFAALVQVVVLLAAAFVLSPLLTFAGLVAGLVIMVVLTGFVTLARRAGDTNAALTQSLNKRLTDALQCFKPLKAMGVERWLLPLLSHENQGLRRATRQQVVAKYGLSLLREPILVIFIAVGLYLAVGFTSIAMTELLVMAILFHRTASSMAIVQQSYQQVGTSQAFFHSIDALIREAEEAAEAPHGGREPTLEQSITFERVDFSYTDRRRVLFVLELDIPARSLTAIIGTSGSGKTTIVDLICGLLSPDEGRIAIDGVDLREIDIPRWRRRIGYVPQDLFLFHDTVRANITLGDDSLDDRAVWEALEAADARDYVTDLESGLDTVIGERGSRLSGGQRQRLAIARALVRNPLLVVLDEATTALDPATEKEVIETVSRLKSKLTVLAISHQPGIVALADHTFRLDPASLGPEADTQKVDSVQT